MSFLLSLCSPNEDSHTVERNTEKRRFIDHDKSTAYDESLISSKEEEITALSKENESLKNQISELKSQQTYDKSDDLKTSESVDTQYQQQIATAIKEKDAYSQKVEELTKSVKDTQQILDTKQKQIDESKEEKLKLVKCIIY